MATNEEQIQPWLAASLAWEHTLSRLRRVAASEEADAADPADACRADRMDIATRPDSSRRVVEGRTPRREHSDDGVTTSA